MRKLILNFESLSSGMKVFHSSDSRFNLKKVIIIINFSCSNVTYFLWSLFPSRCDNIFFLFIEFLCYVIMCLTRDKSLVLFIWFYGYENVINCLFVPNDCFHFLFAKVFSGQFTVILVNAKFISLSFNKNLLFPKNYS